MIITEKGESQFKMKKIILYNPAVSSLNLGDEIIFEGVKSAGFKAFGGEYSPYVWLQIPEGFTSWSFFDELLEKCNVVGTPGSGFGKMGEGYLRLTGFGSRERTLEAVERIKKFFSK